MSAAGPIGRAALLPIDPDGNRVDRADSRGVTPGVTPGVTRAVTLVSARPMSTPIGRGHLVRDLRLLARLEHARLSAPNCGERSTADQSIPRASLTDRSTGPRSSEEEGSTQ